MWAQALRLLHVGSARARRGGGGNHTLRARDFTPTPLAFAEAKEPFGRFFRIEESGNQTITEFRFTTAN